MSTSLPNILSLNNNSQLSKEESISALVMLGWKHILPNLLLKPASFTIAASIGILDDGFFIFVQDKTGKICENDNICYTHNDPSILIKYSSSIIIQVVLDNTNE